jgi:hypothetical protein
MHTGNGQWGWLREQPPAWPQREHGEDEPSRQRWMRQPEVYEDRAMFEPYPGATVLEDLAESTEDGSARRILARYTVIRILLLSSAGVLTGRSLVTERRIAMEHLALLPRHEWERNVLQRLARLCGEAPSRDIIDATIIAAECAGKRNQRMGAFALYRAGLELAISLEWWEEAARCAGGIARLARLDEAPVSVRVWTWRMRVLQQRALAARAEAEAEAEAEEAERQDREDG